MNGLIFLNTNLFPEGHQLTKFDWSGRLIPNSGIYFDFEIESEPYCEYPKDDSEYLNSSGDSRLWDSKMIWALADRCEISTTKMLATGLLVADSDTKLSLAGSTVQEYKADPFIPHHDYVDRCFHTYISEKADVGEHSIGFRKNTNGLYSVDWTGKIRLEEYDGEEYDYNFFIKAEELRFAGIRIPARISVEEATIELKKFVSDVNEFRVMDFQQDVKSFPEPRFVFAGQ